jgi:hypothetical protein
MIEELRCRSMEKCAREKQLDGINYIEPVFANSDALLF